METLRGSQHPALLLKKCPECNFALKSLFHLSGDGKPPHWILFCHNLSCSLFGDPQIEYVFIPDKTYTIVADNLLPDLPPDTSIESD